MPEAPATSATPATPGAPAPGAVEAASGLDGPLGRRGWLVLGLCALATSFPLLHQAFRAPPPVTVAGLVYGDDFERPEIGADWFTTGGHWRILKGELWAPEAKNNPLWLRMKLPRDVAVEFDARSETATGGRPGDIKFEIFGNGLDHASGYVCVFGGWGNQISVIARLDEHGGDRKERRDTKVEPGRTYHMRVERAGRELRWFVDGRIFMNFDDAKPLEGASHDRFGFSSWEADVFFDRLRIRPL